jgi:hypothetical protein
MNLRNISIGIILIFQCLLNGYIFDMDIAKPRGNESVNCDFLPTSFSPTLEFECHKTHLTDSHKVFIKWFMDSLVKIDRLERFSLEISCHSFQNEIRKNKYVSVMRGKVVKDEMCDVSGLRPEDILIKEYIHKNNEYYFTGVTIGGTWNY